MSVSLCSSLSPPFTSWPMVPIFCGTRFHLSSKISFQISNQVIYCQEINYMIHSGAPHRLPRKIPVFLPYSLARDAYVPVGGEGVHLAVVHVGPLRQRDQAVHHV